MSTDHPRLVKLLESQFNEADSSVFEVGEQRERNHRYYTLQKLGNEQRGQSHYISPDVFDVVEGKKSYFAETFFSGRKAVLFTPNQYGNQQDADEKTAYVDLTLDRNDWYELANDAWHDAFLAKRCVILPQWEDDEETSEEQVEGLTPLGLQQLLTSDPSILSIDPGEGGETQEIVGPQGMMPVYSGPVTIVRDRGYVKLCLIQPERYYRDPNVTYPADGMYAGYSEDVARAELIRRGYDPEQVSALSTDYRFRREEEDNSRKAHDSSWTRRRLHNRSQETETVTLYKTWTWIDASDYLDELEGEGDRYQINPETLMLVEIHWSRGEILRWADGSTAVREVEEIPFLEWTEYKISHAEHGLATADPVAHTQKTNSVLKRLIIDNQQRRNTTRYEAVAGALKNPRELLNNTVGGVIWSRQLGSVQSLDTPELSPLTMGVVEMLDQDKEERSGLSRLAQGMNTDAVRYQNAADMVERLTNAANRRIMKGAKDFAKRMVMKVARAIVKIGAANDDRTYTVEIAGQQVQMVPSRWNVTELTCKVHPALTPDDGIKYAQSLLMMDAQMEAKKQTDPSWGLIYGLEQQHALYDDVFDALGVSDTSRYMALPSSPQVQQAIQQQAMQAQEDRQIQQQLMGLQASVLQSNDKREWFLAQLKGFEVQTDATDKAADNRREDESLRHKKVVDFRELELERQQGNDVARSTNVGGG